MRRPQLGLTARGSALMTAGLTALLCGYVLGQRDLVRVALLLVGAPVIAAVFLSRSRISIACQRSAEPNRVPPGVPILLRISLTNQSFLSTGSLMLEDQLGPPFEQRARFTLDSLHARETRTLAYHLPNAGRGEYRVGPLVMRLADPFGLVERSRSFRSVSDLLILPAVDPLPEAPLPGAWDSSLQAGSHAIGSHGSDDASIRQYRYGDDLRKVHWRSTARLGSMMMRQEERPWHGRTSVLFDARALAHRRRPSAVGDDGPDADDARRWDSFEWGLSAVASVAMHLQNRGRSLDLLAGDLVLRDLTSGPLLDRMARMRPSTASSLGPMLNAADSGGDDANIFAVLGTLDESALRLLTRRHRSPGSALCLLLETPTWAGTDPASRPVSRPAARGDARASTRNDGRNVAGSDGGAERAELALTGAGWRVQRVRAGTPVADAWMALLTQSSGPAFRLPSDLLGGRT